MVSESQFAPGMGQPLGNASVNTLAGFSGSDNKAAPLATAADEKEVTNAEAQAPPAKPPDSKRQQVLCQAQYLRDKMVACYMSAVLPIGLLTDMPLESLALYRDQMLHDCGNPKDPIEAMLVEQLMIAHHAIGRLHLQANTAPTAEIAATYMASATRLTAEFRRTALALGEYRGMAAARAGRVSGNGPEEEPGAAGNNGKAASTKAAKSKVEANTKLESTGAKPRWNKRSELPIPAELKSVAVIG